VDELGEAFCDGGCAIRGCHMLFKMMMSWQLYGDDHEVASTFIHVQSSDCIVSSNRMWLSF
jgi:hypothetical protein